jgi:hypothetical protein
LAINVGVAACIALPASVELATGLGLTLGVGVTKMICTLGIVLSITGRGAAIESQATNSKEMKQAIAKVRVQYQLE